MSKTAWIIQHHRYFEPGEGCLGIFESLEDAKALIAEHLPKFKMKREGPKIVTYDGPYLEEIMVELVALNYWFD